MLDAMAELDAELSGLDRNHKYIEAEAHQEPYVLWLWRTKVKSRASFLAICEFLPLAREHLEKVFVMLGGPIGTEFYAQFVAKNH